MISLVVLFCSVLALYYTLDGKKIKLKTIYEVNVYCRMGLHVRYMKRKGWMHNLSFRHFTNSCFILKLNFYMIISLSYYSVKRIKFWKSKWNENKDKEARKRKWNCKFCFRRRVYWGKLEAGSGESQHNHAFEHTHDFFYNIKTNWNLSYLILLQVFIALVVFWKYIKYYEVVNLTKKGEKYN